MARRPWRKWPPSSWPASSSSKSDGYQVAADLRQMVVFAQHNIIKDAPFTKLDLISCHNLVIYFQPLAQKKPSRSFISA